MAPGNQNHVNRILKESLRSLSQAAKRFPPARGSKPPSPGAVWRWIRDGVRTAENEIIRLEAILVAGRWLTSDEAIVRFVEAQQPKTIEVPAEPISQRHSHRATTKASTLAERNLEELGL